MLPLHHHGSIKGPSRGVSPLTVVVAEMDFRPQDEMSNSQGMKVFAVERHEISEDFVLRVMCNRRRSYLLRIMRSSVVHYRGMHQEMLGVSEFTFS